MIKNCNRSANKDALSVWKIAKVSFKIQYGMWTFLWLCKESDRNAGDPSSIPGLERCPGEESGYPLQYSYLGNLMDRGAWQATIPNPQSHKESDTTELLTLYGVWEERKKESPGSSIILWATRREMKCPGHRVKAVEPFHKKKWMKF